VRLPVFLLFTYNTTRSWSLDFASTPLPNLFYCKRQILQYMETVDIDAFDHAANCLVSVGSQLDLPFAYWMLNATPMSFHKSFQGNPCICFMWTEKIDCPDQRGGSGCLPSASINDHLPTTKLLLQYQLPSFFLSKKRMGILHDGGSKYEQQETCRETIRPISIA
jgi:hypothetical protein